MLRRALDGLYLACGILAGVMLVAMTGLMLLMSFGRFVALNIRGGDEITSWLMAASAFLGLAYTFRHGDLIRVGLLVERFTGRPRRWLEIVALGIASLLLGAFAWNMAVMVWESWIYGEYAQGALAVPIWIPQSGMALGVIVLFVAFIDELIRVLLGAKPSYEREPPKTVDELIERAAESGV